MYTFPRRIYWLRRLENFKRKERVQVDEYTIEHIMPQNDNLSSKWRQMLGPDWQTIHSTHLHRLGNLTLTGYNSEYSDRPFLEKRDMEGGFALSPLQLNKGFGPVKGLGSIDVWNEGAIVERSEQLAEVAVKVWPAPTLPPSVLEQYKPKATATSYSLSDHPSISSGKMQALFEVLRAEILALDACVTEDFLKLYVAYKAETNFVDVIPQAKRLILALNVSFNDISDPRQLCKDVTGLGKWGNGDAQIALSTVEELPYVMGLIRTLWD
jgi:predicted transport protein